MIGLFDNIDFAQRTRYGICFCDYGQEKMVFNVGLIEQRSITIDFKVGGKSSGNGTASFQLYLVNEDMVKGVTVHANIWNWHKATIEVEESLHPPLKLVIVRDPNQVRDTLVGDACITCLYINNKTAVDIFTSGSG